MDVKWHAEPEAHDSDAAAAYLSLLGVHGVVAKTVAHCARRRRCSQ